MITSKRVLFVGILGNTKRTMWRIQRLMQVVKGVKTECTFSTGTPPLPPHPTKLHTHALNAHYSSQTDIHDRRFLLMSFHHC